MNKVKIFFKEYKITILIYLTLLLLYNEVSKHGIINRFMFPTIDSIFKMFAKDRYVMLLNFASSMRLLIPAIFLALALALLLGTIVGLNPRLRKIMNPIIYTVSIVPAILLSPFALTLAPSFWAASLFLIVYATIWSTLFATITGIISIDKRYLDKAAGLELTGFRRFFMVILPAASPSILSGFVSSLRSAFLMLVYAEMYGNKYGMGFYVRKYSEFGLYSNTWAGFVFMVIVLVTVMQIFERIKNRILKWTMN